MFKAHFLWRLKRTSGLAENVDGSCVKENDKIYDLFTQRFGQLSFEGCRIAGSAIKVIKASNALSHLANCPAI